MFKNLLAFWRGKDFLSQVLKEFEQMMVDSEDMFRKVRARLIDGVTEEGLCDKIYETDRKINQLEKDIRIRIVEHLALQPSVNIPVCLVLMSVVKDAERLGDYAKNIYEVSDLLKKPLDKNLFRSYLNAADEKLVKLAEMTRSAFMLSDENVARELSVLEREIVIQCEDAIKKLAEGNLDSNVSVCYTLVARYFKRIAVHLVNIGTSVILPINELDFHDEKIRHEKMKK